MTHCVDTPLYTPAKSLSILARLKQAYDLRAKRRADRALFRSMKNLSPEILQDIGVSSGDIVWAANLPIEKDASKALQCVAHCGASSQ